MVYSHISMVKENASCDQKKYIPIKLLLICNSIVNQKS
ncbi:MAG: hypothetical protein ACI9Q4_002649 [Sediminicola sp.]|jgi:hypothetical protein